MIKINVSHLIALQEARRTGRSNRTIFERIRQDLTLPPFRLRVEIDEVDAPDFLVVKDAATRLAFDRNNMLIPIPGVEAPPGKRQLVRSTEDGDMLWMFGERGPLKFRNSPATRVRLQRLLDDWPAGAATQELKCWQVSKTYLENLLDLLTIKAEARKR